MPNKVQFLWYFLKTIETQVVWKIDFKKISGFSFTIFEDCEKYSAPFLPHFVQGQLSFLILYVSHWSLGDTTVSRDSPTTIQLSPRGRVTTPKTHLCHNAEQTHCQIYWGLSHCRDRGCHNVKKRVAILVADPFSSHKKWRTLTDFFWRHAGFSTRNALFPKKLCKSVWLFILFSNNNELKSSKLL